MCVEHKVSDLESEIDNYIKYTNRGIERILLFENIFNHVCIRYEILKRWSVTFTCVIVIIHSLCEGYYFSKRYS